MSAKIGTDIARRVSHSKKVANDFQRQKDIMDIYDTWYGDYREYDKIGKYDTNYDLFNGRLDVSLYEDPVCLNVEGEKVKFDFKNITHYPLISQVANAMHGEMITRPFKPVAKDLGSFSQTSRNKKWNELLRELMEAEIIAPMRDEITQAYLQQQNIQDVFQLTPEQVQQMEADIGARVQAKTPEDILDFMQNDFETPTQRQAQQLLDYFLVHQDIKTKQEQGFKHAIITGQEVYYIGDNHGEPTIDLVNPKYFSWAGSQNTEWYQDGTWAKYEQWLTIEEATQKYAEYFTRSAYAELEGFAEPIGGVRSIGDPRKDQMQARVMYELSIEESHLAKKYDHINYRTRKGQSDIVRLYEDVVAKYGNNYGYAFSNYGIRETHITWRDKRKLYRVTRLVDNKEKHFWQDEHYEPRPDDLEILEVWVDEIWEGTKLGSSMGNDLYLKIRPIPGQYKSIFNPFGVQLPYIGKAYNTHMGNANNVSIVDLGKPWQKEFDVTMAQVKLDMATDFGNVFLMSLGLKPDNWKWQDWFDTMKNGKILMTQLNKHGFGNVNPDTLRSINLSKASDIANKIGLLDYFRNQLVQSMNFNDTRIGSIGQYTTNANIQQSQSASYNQTEGYFETHRKIVEKALNMFMNRARLVYKDNNKTKFILDDITRTDLEISPDFWYEEWAIEFSTSSDEIRKVEELRANMQAFVQNQMSFDGILALSLANTPSDIVSIMKKETKRQDDMRREQAESQQAQLQAQLQAQAQEKAADREFTMTLEMAKLQSQERRTSMDMDKFRLQNDVDRNNVADTIQKSIFEQEIKLGIEQAKIQLELQKNSDAVRLKEAELGIDAAEKGFKKDKDDSDTEIKRKELEIKRKQASKPSGSK